jgi:hypothetical protein
MSKNFGGDLNDDLGGEVGETGHIDMFGLDEFGVPQGPNSMWGAMMGVGVATGASIVTRALTKPESTFYKYSEAVGMAAGVLAGGAMMAHPKSRQMGMAAMATAVVSNGLRQLEAILLTPGQVAKAAEKGTWGGVVINPTNVVSGWGNVVIDPTNVVSDWGQDVAVNGLGIATIEPGYAVNGFGAPMIEPAFPVKGLGNMPELVGPPSLVGAGNFGMSDNPAVAQTQILGGPAVSGLSMHYGATLFGSKS